VTLRRVEAELEQHKLAAKQFSDHFQQFTLIDAQLKELQATRQQLHNELTRLELNQAAELAHMTVLERATMPSDPIRSEKVRDIGIALGVALLLGLFGVWLLEFLMRSRKEQSAPSVTVNLNEGLHLASAVAAPPVAITAPVSADAALADAHRPEARRIEAGPVVRQSTAPDWDQPPPPPPQLDAAERILGPGELAILWSACEGEARVVLALLLNGVGPQELAALSGEDLDLAQGELGVGERIVPLSPALQCLLSGSLPLAPTQALLSEDARAPGGVDALLGCAAIDAGLEAPIEIDAGRVQCSYLVWLVSQGVKLADLKRVAGTLSPGYLAEFAPWSPAGPGHTLEQIDPFLPFLLETGDCGAGSPG
jgi:integrase